MSKHDSIFLRTRLPVLVVYLHQGLRGTLTLNLSELRRRCEGGVKALNREARRLGVGEMVEGCEQLGLAGEF